MDPRYKSPGANVERDEDTAFRELGAFTTAVQWMLRAGAALAAISLLSSLMQLDLLSRSYTPAEGQANDLREGAIGATLLLRIATLITFGRWIVLAHRNLVPLGASYLEFRPGWAVGWFFIPIGNLWKPYQAMKALWQNSHSVAKPELQDTTWLLPTWWTLWLISAFVGSAVNRMTLRAKTIEDFVVSTEMTIVNIAVELPLYFVAAALLGQIWRAQQVQREHPEEFRPVPGFADGGGAPR